MDALSLLYSQKIRNCVSPPDQYTTRVKTGALAPNVTKGYGRKKETSVLGGFLRAAVQDKSCSLFNRVSWNKMRREKPTTIDICAIDTRTDGSFLCAKIGQEIFRTYVMMIFDSKGQWCFYDKDSPHFCLENDEKKSEMITMPSVFVSCWIGSSFRMAVTAMLHARTTFFGRSVQAPSFATWLEAYIIYATGVEIWTLPTVGKLQFAWQAVHDIKYPMKKIYRCYAMNWRSFNRTRVGRRRPNSAITKRLLVIFVQTFAKTEVLLRVASIHRIRLAVFHIAVADQTKTLFRKLVLPCWLIICMATTYPSTQIDYQ